MLKESCKRAAPASMESGLVASPPFREQLQARAQVMMAAMDGRAAKGEAAALAFETAKFNMVWTKMKEAEERDGLDSPKYKQLREDVEEQGKLVESLGGSLPAEMLTLEQASEKARKVREDLSFEKLWNMTNEERWVLAQGLGPAFPVSLVLSYTAYWALNVPFITYAYFTTVVSGQATMALVMTGAYATSVPFKPLIYIGAILGTPWTADNIMPVLAKIFSLFRMPDDKDFDR
eukprot:CAMPEP_0178459476 /NCGR_PEP_ID=MMETSP0689_2-20121128/48152_1 /TAXON_ID=160604 /ORGANISM="Amphidinium massartii, Strain CS-259" /LENGTH=233 /DNA_ID=CAMNT_0020085959 /DNA_START=246 /DNA_END=945 /DNA_ORIENTATION=-